MKKEMTVQEAVDLLMEVATFGTLTAQKEMNIGYLVFDRDSEGIRYRVWVEDVGDQDVLKIEKYDKDDERVQ